MWLAGSLGVIQISIAISPHPGARGKKRSHWVKNRQASALLNEWVRNSMCCLLLLPLSMLFYICLIKVSIPPHHAVLAAHTLLFVEVGAPFPSLCFAILLSLSQVCMLSGSCRQQVASSREQQDKNIGYWPCTCNNFFVVLEKIRGCISATSVLLSHHPLSLHTLRFEDLIDLDCVFCFKSIVFGKY